MASCRNLHLDDRDLSSRHDARAASSIGEPDHAGRGGLRSGQNADQRCLRCKDDGAPDPPRRTKVPPLARRCLCDVPIGAARIGVRTVSERRLPGSKAEPGELPLPQYRKRVWLDLSPRPGRSMQCSAALVATRDSGERVTGRGRVPRERLSAIAYRRQSAPAICDRNECVLLVGRPMSVRGWTPSEDNSPWQREVRATPLRPSRDMPTAACLSLPCPRNFALGKLYDVVTRILQNRDGLLDLNQARRAAWKRDFGKVDSSRMGRPESVKGQRLPSTASMPLVG
jgi:hypothetical protein